MKEIMGFSRKRPASGAAKRGSSLFRRVHNGQKAVGLQRGAADQAAVDVGLGEEALGVLGLHAAAVLDSDAVGEVLVPHFGKGLADEGVDFLGLGVGGGAAGADGPDGLVGDDEAPWVGDF